MSDMPMSRWWGRDRSFRYKSLDLYNLLLNTTLRNSKLEARNPKQIQMTEIQNQKHNQLVSTLTSPWMVG